MIHNNGLNGAFRFIGEAPTEELAEVYRDNLIDLFLNAPEGIARADIDPEVGFWSYQFMYYAHAYLDLAIDQMTLNDVQEIMLDLFPRKVSIFSPEDANDAIPELIAFWRYLKREYQLEQAKPIRKFLSKIEPHFQDVMNNPDNFGSAKSCFLQSLTEGLDITPETDINTVVYAPRIPTVANSKPAPSTKKRKKTKSTKSTKAKQRSKALMMTAKTKKKKRLDL